MVEKTIDAFRTISEVAEDLDLPQHVLRFWETRFPQIKPMKRGGGRRYYRPEDVELLRAIRQLLYGEGYTIKGVQRILKDQGPRAVAKAVASGEFRSPARPPAADAEAEDFEDEAPLPPAASPAPRPAPDFESPLRDDAAPRPLSDDARARLRAALADLAECERILAAARRL